MRANSALLRRSSVGTENSIYRRLDVTAAPCGAGSRLMPNGSERVLYMGGSCPMSSGDLYRELSTVGLVP